MSAYIRLIFWTVLTFFFLQLVLVSLVLEGEAALVFVFFQDLHNLISVHWLQISFGISDLYSSLISFTFVVWFDSISLLLLLLELSSKSVLHL